MKISELRDRVNEIWGGLHPDKRRYPAVYVRVEVLGAVFTLPITAVSLDGDRDVVIDVRACGGIGGRRNNDT